MKKTPKNRLTKLTKQTANRLTKPMKLTTSKLIKLTACSRLTKLLVRKIKAENSY